MKTQKQFLALLKTPYAFLEAYATARAEASAVEWNAENPEDTPITGAQVIEDDYGNDVVAFVDEECMNKPIEGIVLNDVYSVGGGEGGGESVIRVWSVKVDGEIKAHIRVTGFYQSYNGTDYNEDAELVEAHEVIETKYFTPQERKRDKTSRFI